MKFYEFLQLFWMPFFVEGEGGGKGDDDDDDDAKKKEADDAKKKEADDAKKKEEDDAKKKEEDDAKKKEGDDGKKKEGDDDGKKKEGDDDGKREPHIPKSRLDFKNTQLKRAQQEIDSLKKQLEKSGVSTDAKAGKEEDKEDPVAELDKKLNDAIEADDTKLVAKLSIERQNLLIDQLKQGYEQQAPEIIAKTRDEIELNTFVDQMEKDFPQLDHENDKYDKDLVDEINMLYDSLISGGQVQSSVDAMSMAVSYVMGSSTESTADKSKDTADKRAKDARQKALDAAKNQPGSDEASKRNSDSAGMDGKDLDAAKLTDEDLEKLPPDTLKRMRGDYAE